MPESILSTSERIARSLRSLEILRRASRARARRLRGRARVGRGVRVVSAGSVPATALVLVERPVSETFVAAGGDRRAREPAARHQAGDPEPRPADRAHQALQPLSRAARPRRASTPRSTDAARHGRRADRTRAVQRPDQDRGVQPELHRRHARDRRRGHQRDRRVLRRPERPHAVGGGGADHAVPEGAARRGAQGSSSSTSSASAPTQPRTSASCRSRSS